MRGMIVLLLIITLIPYQKTVPQKVTETTFKKPNILWIVTEDISPTLSFYGDKTAKTPNLDVLAKQSLIYDNAFAVVGVCGPSRSSIITGMYPTSIGTMHMRTGKDIHSWGKRSYSKESNKTDLDKGKIVEYSAVIPDNVKCYTEYLRAVDYYCTNNQKTDYQFASPVTAWDENNAKSHWRNTPKNKPFFSVFNIGTTHESQLWKKNKLPLTVNPKDVKVPPYLPDNSATRNTIARHYSNVELMDVKVGEILNQLKKDGLYDNTIIFFYSDHGGPLPRQKREIYDSGLKVPFMIKGINGEIGRTDRMISFVDLAPTMLSLAGVQAPDYMEGKSFLGAFVDPENEYVFGSSDRFDEFTDRTRAVRTQKFLYLKNDFPEITKYKDVGYRKNIAMMPLFLQMRKKNQLNEIENKWFQTKTKEELYDCIKDPHNINNLAEKPEYQTDLAGMRTILEAHLKDRKDYGLISESKMIQEMWPNFEQQITINPIIQTDNNKTTISSKTKGTSIGYIISKNANEKLDLNSKWQLYHQPLTVQKGKTIYTIAQRIGFKESDITSHKIN